MGKIVKQLKIKFKQKNITISIINRKEIKIIISNLIMKIRKKNKMKEKEKKKKKKKKKKMKKKWIMIKKKFSSKILIKIVIIPKKMILTAMMI